MNDATRAVTATTPGADRAPGVFRLVFRRDVLRLAAVAPGVAWVGLPERVVVSADGWILLESDLR